jgi:N-acetylneuraminic acid mutarotase
VDVYDPATDTWRSAAPLPYKLTHATAAVEGTRIWVAGGIMGDYPGTVVDRVIVYDSTADQWFDGPPLPKSRAAGAFVAIGDALHYAAGYSDLETAASEHWVLNFLEAPGGWQARSSAPSARGHVSAAVLRGKLYLIGGMQGHYAEPVDRAEVQIYSPEDDSWSEGPSLPTARSHSEAATLAYGDRILTIGGRSVQPYSRFGPIPRRMDLNLPNVTVLDPDRGWTEEQSLPIGLRGPFAGIVDGVLIVAGGSVFMGSHGQAGLFTLPISELLTP